MCIRDRRNAYQSLEVLKRYCEYFNQVGEKCNAKGIRFGYHNHANEFRTEYEGKPLYDWMLELTDPAKVMFQIDLYWIVEGGKDPLDYFCLLYTSFFISAFKCQFAIARITIQITKF